MKNVFLNNFAKKVLCVNRDGFSKVLFAKILYLTFKGLVKKGLVNTYEMKFIRMPLGPVPVGFNSLADDPDLEISKEIILGLAYNMQVYKIKPNICLPVDKETQKLVRRLKSFPTSELVEYTHSEPSWKSHINGEEYYLTGADLKRDLPKVKKIKINPGLDNQRLQARLIEGMLDEIVEESTSLEYPNLDK